MSINIHFYWKVFVTPIPISKKQPQRGDMCIVMRFPASSAPKGRHVYKNMHVVRGELNWATGV